MQNVSNLNWRTLPEFPDYAITPDGQVWSYYTNKFLKLVEDKYGYLIVVLYNDLGPTTCKVHRLVGKAFVPLPPEFNGNYDMATINHKDHNRQNNHYLNLEWVTREENAQEAWDNGYCDDKKKECFCVSIEDEKFTKRDSASDMDKSLNLPEGTVKQAINRGNGILQGKYIVGYTENLDKKYLLPKPDAVGIIQLYSTAIANYTPYKIECFLIDSSDNSYIPFDSYAAIDKHLDLPARTTAKAIDRTHGLIRGRYIAGAINDVRWKKILPKCTVEQIVKSYEKQIERYKQRGPRKITNLETGESETYESLADFAREQGILPNNASNYLKARSDLYKVELA